MCLDKENWKYYENYFGHLNLEKKSVITVDSVEQVRMLYYSWSKLDFRLWKIIMAHNCGVYFHL